MNYSDLLFVSGIDRTYVDIVFTLIASSDFSNKTYALIKTTAKQFIEEYEYVNITSLPRLMGCLVNFRFGVNDSSAVAGPDLCSRFLHDVTKIQTKKLSILLSFYFQGVLQQLNTLI